MHFLSIGECMAELAPTDVSGHFRLGYAGDTFNTAWYLQKLCPGSTVSYFTALGTDELSTRMSAAIAETGIRTDDIIRLPDRTIGMYLISLKDGERSFTYWRDTAAARHLADDPVPLKRAMAQADLVYFSGITLAILDHKARDNFLHALNEARAAGKAIVFDPNLRPRLWASADEMTATIMRGASISSIALPSFEDEASHFNDADPLATVARYADAGVETIIVKNGPGAVHFRSGDKVGTATIPVVADVVDTTAAGDSFNAGFLAALDQGRSIEESIIAGSHVAGQVIQGKGALVPVDL